MSSAAARREVADDGWLVDQLLSLKWGYLDGHLSRWTAGGRYEILLELFPRKVSLPDEDVDEVIPSTKRFLNFLDQEGLLADGESLPTLVAALARRSRRFGAVWHARGRRRLGGRGPGADRKGQPQAEIAGRFVLDDLDERRLGSAALRRLCERLEQPGVLSVAGVKERLDRFGLMEPAAAR